MHKSRGKRVRLTLPVKKITKISLDLKKLLEPNLLDYYAIFGNLRYIFKFNVMIHNGLCDIEILL